MVLSCCRAPRSTNPKARGSTPLGRTIEGRGASSVPLPMTNVAEVETGEAEDERCMQLALHEARRAEAGGEVPVGAVVVLDGRVIGRGHNRVIAESDPTAHAEIVALRDAAKRVANYRLVGAELFSTVEPCPMCCGAAVNARVARVVYGAADPKAGAARTLYRLLDDARLNHQVAVAGGVRRAECASLLSEFFQKKRS
jgi:tRNA(adenine34) deaminase